MFVFASTDHNGRPIQRWYDSCIITVFHFSTIRLSQQKMGCHMVTRISRCPLSGVVRQRHPILRSCEIGLNMWDQRGSNSTRSHGDAPAGRTATHMIVYIP